MFICTNFCQLNTFKLSDYFRLLQKKAYVIKKHLILKIHCEKEECFLCCDCCLITVSNSNDKIICRRPVSKILNEKKKCSPLEYAKAKELGATFPSSYWQNLFKQDKSVAVCSSHIDLPEGLCVGPKFLYFSQIECLFREAREAFHAVTSQESSETLGLWRMSIKACALNESCIV